MLTLGAPAARAQAPETIDQRDTGARSQEDTRDEVIVTGTNIRGAAPKSSPVVVIDAEDLQASGFATIGDYFEFLPQNFAGLGDDGARSGTGSDGPAINLRGLGANETLVLINGRRVASSTTLGSFVDLSQIPATAVERMEILLDGASATYGADAVAGVVNIILKTDAEGLLVNTRYGTVTQGNLREYRASATGGLGWGSGNLSLSYEFFDRAELLAGDRDFVVADAEFDLIPGETRHSFVASGNQQLSDSITLTLDALVSFEDSEPAISTGASFLTNDIDRNLYWLGAGFLGSALGFDYDVQGSYSFRENDIFNTSSGTQRIFDFRNDTSVLTLDARASRPIFSLPGGDAAIGFGGGYRNQEVQVQTLDPDGNELFFINADRGVWHGFGEVVLPIVSSGNNIPLISEFEINASVRHEEFSDFGGSTNPKVGVAWSPIEGLQIRSSYGTSFRAPELRSINGNPSVRVFNIGAFGAVPFPELGDNIAFIVSGANPDLTSQESRNITVGADYQPAMLPGLSVSLNYFDIEYENQIGSPLVVLGFANAVLGEDGRGFYRVNPPQALLEDFVNRATSAESRVPQVDFDDPSTLSAINLFFDGRDQNIANSSAKGLDINIAYDVSTDIGDFALGVNGVYLFENAFAVTDDAPLVDTVDTAENPVDLQFRANVGYSRGGFSSSIFVNYVDSYTNTIPAESVEIDSWTTVDLSIAYAFGRNTGVFEQSQIRLSMQNIFDTDPPFVEGTGFANNGVEFNYDAANANPRGRFVAFEITKQF